MRFQKNKIRKASAVLMILLLCLPVSVQASETGESTMGLTVTVPERPESEIFAPEGTESLKDIPLPEGWHWKEPDKKLKPGTTKEFVAQYKDTNQEVIITVRTPSEVSEKNDDKPDKPEKPVKPSTDKEEPFIRGDAGKKGWEVIIDHTKVAKDGDKIVVDMNGSTKVPGKVIESIAGKDVTVVFDMGDGILWTVNGKSVTSDNIGDINFAVSKNTKNIPVDIINNVTGERCFMTISIEHNGEFGFTAVMTINMEKKNVGLLANLFYYNKKAADGSGKLEFMCADEIDADGNADLTFTHASDYTIVIDKEPMDGSKDAQDSAPASPNTGDAIINIMDYLWVIVISSVVIIACIGRYIYFAKRKHNIQD